jgi:methanethiol S-methyltransferase
VLASAGAAILAGSLVSAIPVIRIAPLTAPARREPLRTGGRYSIVRDPLMLCDIFWPPGLPAVFGSIIGIVLTSAWLLVIWVLTQVEEESLVREYGDTYRDFQARVPRLFPRPRPGRRRPA